MSVYKIIEIRRSILMDNKNYMCSQPNHCAELSDYIETIKQIHPDLSDRQIVEMIDDNQEVIIQ